MNKIINIINEEIRRLTENSNDLSGSLWGLIKYNGGYFKSDKQRDFFLNKARRQNTAAANAGAGGAGENVLAAGGNVYGNSYMNFFTLDDEGITKVEKYTRAQGSRVTWERSDENTAKAREADLNTKFHKAVRKLIERSTEEFNARKEKIFAEIKKFYPEFLGDRDLEAMQSVIARGEFEKNMDSLKQIYQQSQFPFVKANIMLGEFLQKAIDDGLIATTGRPFNNWHPTVNDMTTGKPLPQYQSPEAKQAFIDKMNV